MYAEKALVSIDGSQKITFSDLISNRIVECEKESQVKRLEKVIKKKSKI
jgi:hypothetical protein